MSVAQTIKAEVISLCPEFAPFWDDKCDLYVDDDGSFSIHAVFTLFSRYIADRLMRSADPELHQVFEYVESKLTDDDSEVHNAACTCFLENLMNRVPDKIPAGHLIPFLGPKSRRFCRAWDEWCGMKTEGLW